MSSFISTMEQFINKFIAQILKLEQFEVFTFGHILDD